MTQKPLHDEAMALFIADHETTAQMLAWTWYALSENLLTEARLHEELDGVVGGRVRRKPRTLGACPICKPR